MGRMLLRRILRSEPEYELVEAKDGLIAWEMLQGGLVPELITLDIMMPRMDGLDLLVRIRATHRLKGVKVIMCTAVNDRPRVISANSLDIDGYVLKPFTSKKLLDQIQHVLHKEPLPTLSDPAGLDVAPPKPFDWTTYANDLEALTRSTAANLGNLRVALATEDQETAMHEAESMRAAGQKMGMATLADAANRLGSAILLGDVRNISTGMQAVDAARKEVLETLAKLNQTSASGVDAKPHPTAHA